MANKFQAVTVSQVTVSYVNCKLNNCTLLNLQNLLCIAEDKALKISISTST